jgi:carbamoyltransferase
MPKKTYYLGLSVTYHDPALAIVDDQGEVLFAEATERFMQYKRALNCEPDTLLRLPSLLREHCADAERIVAAFNWRVRRPWYERAAAAAGLLSPKGLLRLGFKRLRSPLENYQIHHAMACNRLSIARAGLNLARVLREHFPRCALEFRDFDHHDAHAACACYGSPFDEALCAVIDSYGERGALAFYRYRDGRLERFHEGQGLGSLGLYYMKLTELCGFDWSLGEEWKVMGLAAYGRLDEEIYALLQNLLEIQGLDIAHGETLFEALEQLETKRRRPQDPAQLAADLAYTGQFFFEQSVSALLDRFHAAHPGKRLALAGGCALNSACNGQLLAYTPFSELYVPPAPADDGAALGTAWLAFHQDHRKHWRGPKMLSPYLGSAMSPDALARLARQAGGLDARHLPASICEETARLLAQGKLVGWMQGRAEFGPRALGNRSILADPRDPAMKERINARVKFREEFRPFAPSILPEYGPDYFEHYQASPYMERALRFRPEGARRAPATVHVDGTGRLQTVRADWNPRFHRLLQAFHRETHVPVLLNTSFNLMGKPIAHSVEDAIAVFMTCGLDVLVIGDWLFAKPQQP